MSLGFDNYFLKNQGKIWKKSYLRIKFTQSFYMTCDLYSFEFWKSILIIIFGSGFGTAIVGFYMKFRFEKSLIRFTKVYSDNFMIAKKIYSDVVKVESALETYLSSREPKENEKLQVFNKKTSDIFSQFIEEFNQNEIIFSDDEIKLLSEIVKLIEEAKSAHILATLSEDSRGSEFWLESLNKKANLSKESSRRFNELKISLKKSFQKKYKIL